MTALTKPDDIKPTRASLLERVKNWDDHESWKVFFDTYWNLVYSVSSKAGLRSAEADDATAATMLSVAKKIRDFHYDPSLGKFRSWLIRNTMWRVLEQFEKRKKPDAPLTLVDSEEDAAAIEEIPDASGDEITRMAEEEWARHLVQLALENVKKLVNPRHFHIYQLLVLQEVPAAEVAELCDVEVNNVYGIKNRVGNAVLDELRKLEKQTI